MNNTEPNPEKQEIAQERISLKNVKKSHEKAQGNFKKKSLNELVSECKSQMAQNGCPFDGDLALDGEMQRFSRDEKKKKPDEWYVGYVGESSLGTPYLNCAYGTFEGGFVKFIYNSYSSDETLSKDERNSISEEWKKRHKDIDEKLIKDDQEKLEKAKKAWEKALSEPNVDGHTAYLKNKKVQAYGIRYSKDYYGEDAMILPLRNIDGNVQAIQFISPDGTKRIHGNKKGNFHLIGETKEAEQILVCEGYSTGASIHEVTGLPVVVAIDCGNLYPVIENLNKKFPKHSITIAADNDVETKDNPGKKYAEGVAKRFKCNVILPSFPDDFKLPDGKRPTDFNDLHAYFGLEIIKKQLPRKNRLNPVNIDDLINRKIPPKKEILHPWLREKDLVMIYAPRGIGKTWFALNVAYAIASGGKFLKYKAKEPKRVLYVDGEMAAVLMQERIVSIKNSSENDPPDPSFFRLITHDLEENPIRDLASKEGQFDINAHLNDFDVLVLDNLSCLVRSGDENEAASWVIIQEWLLYLRKMGKTVILIHHAGKGGQQRGSSKKEDILDTVVALKKPKISCPSDGAKFEVHYEKNRGFGGDDAIPFEAQLINNSKGVPEWVFKDLENRNKENALALLSQGMSMSEVAKEVGVNKSTISRWNNSEKL